MALSSVTAAKTLAKVAKVSGSRLIPAASVGVKRSMGGDAHDDHPHLLFEPPFSKVGSAILVFGGVALGVGACTSACSFQNKKSGFTS
eukprot:CAMPEP_0113939830 /NCGR_PEP_ID=MMETSP1339-20121228/6077_1 /TAXON_ID=94617 /ORGANISM="Fibrocapsa japonica" /LENGTH=87 /DNA_ID=CAMNT_0000943447 /DNA_START=60 /DNA_END=323 /DNA_ORIENTATION=- /assembly_acc=CAM_ASM_000762